MMKTAEFFTAFIAATLLFACSDGDDNKGHYGDFGAIKVPDTRQLTQKVAPSASQDAAEVTFTTEDAWISSIVETTRAETPEWIAISPDHGDAAGDYTIRLILTPNETNATRTAEITITCDSSTITISVTQKGSEEDEPQPVDPAKSQVKRIDCYSVNSDDGPQSRWTSSYHFEHDAKGRLTAIKWDDTPDNTTDPMDAITTFTYPDATTVKIHCKGEEEARCTVTLNAEGYATEARLDGQTDRWTFDYDNTGHCIECKQHEVFGSTVYPRSTFTWTNGNLTAFDTFSESGSKVPDYSYAYEYTRQNNKKEYISIDLNVMCSQVYPGYRPINSEDIAFLLGVADLLGKRSANFANATEEYDMWIHEDPVNQIIEYSELEKEVVNWLQEWDPEGRISEYNVDRIVGHYRTNLKTGKTERISEYSSLETFVIHYNSDKD